MDGEGMMFDDSGTGMEVTAEGWYEGNWCLFLVLSCLFTRTFYRVFILWCEYLMRLFSFHVYKGNAKLGIRKMLTWQGNMERMVREWAHENEEMIWKHTVVQREQMDGVASHCRLLSRIGGIRSFGLPLLTTIIIFSITVIVLLCQWLQAQYLWIVQ
jgi:hypothetical protein